MAREIGPRSAWTLVCLRCVASCCDCAAEISQTRQVCCKASVKVLAHLRKSRGGDDRRPAACDCVRNAVSDRFSTAVDSLGAQKKLPEKHTSQGGKGRRHLSGSDWTQ